MHLQAAASKLFSRGMHGLVLIALLTGMAGLMPVLPAQAEQVVLSPSDSIYQSLPFSQDWSNIGLITIDDNWSGVAGITGYLGDGLSGSDPRLIIGPTLGAIDVNANETNPNTFTQGGVTEFDITNPVVALAGSVTADAPSLIIYINASGMQDITLAYNVRDIDGSTDNAIQPLALQYRIGNSGNFTNLPDGYIADASSGPNLATLVTSKSVVLPAAANNQAELQLRFITVDAAGSDEWLGIDDISVTGSPLGPTNPSAVGSASPLRVQPGQSTLLTVAVTPGTNPTSSGLSVSANLSSIGGAAGQVFYDDGTNGDITLNDNIFSFAISLDAEAQTGAYSLPVTIQDAQARSANTNIALSIYLPIHISQVYGGGGTGTALYLNDFVELYNPNSSAVDLAGWSVQYASATGTTWSGKTALTGVIQPGGYYLIQLGGGTVGVALPTPDDTGSTAMSSTDGKVALVNSTTTLSTAVCPIPDAGLVDMMGYGTANCFEGSAAPGLSATTALFRAGNGAIDTNVNSSDFSTAAPNPRNTSGGSIESAPYVFSNTPVADATSVAPAANIVVTFSEPVTVSGSWYSIVCASTGTHSAVVSGGPTTFTINPSVDFAASETCTVTIAAALVSDNDSNDPPDAMLTDHIWTFSTDAGGATCNDAYTAISAVQGSGSASPMLNSIKTVQGIVIADLQAGMNGYYIQSLSADGDPATSEGLMIYNTATAVNLGDIVRVTGTVIEYNNQTEINSVSATTICSSSNPLPSPVNISLPTATTGELERYEGMLVHIPQMLYVNQNYFLGRYGQVTLSANNGESDLMYYPSNGNFASATPENNARRMLVLDDASSLQNPNPIPYMDPSTHTQRAGDSVSGLTGILEEGAINSDTTIRGYRLQPTLAPVFTFNASRTAAPDSVGATANLKIATFNVLNYFNGPTFPTSRGADTALEFGRQRAKIIAALQAMNADVVGLMEMENDGTGASSAIQDLVNGLNTAMGANTYAFISEPAPGGDEIKVSIIYKLAVVTPQGAAQNYQTTYGGYTDVFDRPPLIQTLRLNANNEIFTVVVNHFKSRRCTDASGADLDSGSGCYNAKRTAQANALRAFIDSYTTSLADTDVLVLGDLNAYSQEDPLKAFYAATAPRPAQKSPLAPTVDLPLVNVTMYNNRVPAAERFSYVFDGWLGELDHALASATMNVQITGATIWHINSIEPSVIDYNTEFKPQDFYSASPYRSSDHDPIVIGINLTNNPTASEVAWFNAVELPNGQVNLTWESGPQLNLIGFNLYRAATPDAPRRQLNHSLIVVEAPGSLNSSAYSFIDAATQPGQSGYYWLEIVLSDGSSTLLAPLYTSTLFRLYLPGIKN